MKVFRYLFISIISSISIYATIPQDISYFIQKDKIDTKNLSILVKNRSDGSIIASLNPYTPRVPASVAKIATCYAALLEFGKDFKWPTQIFYRGSIKGGVLTGDIVIKAYGDPTLNAKDVKKFAQKIRNYGIREIKGSIFLDRTFFQNSPRITSGFDKNFVSEYNAMPDALMFNDHLNKIIIKPTKDGVVVKRAYGDYSFKIINKLRSVSGSCKGVRAWPKIKFLKGTDCVNVALDGVISNRCRSIVLNKVLSSPYKSFFYSFRYFLNKSGVKFNGGLKLGTKPKDAKLLFTHYSKPLIKIIAKTLKKSNNLYARHLFLILGAKRYGYPATLEKSQRAIKEILSAKGVFDDNDFIVNGSGLSKRARLKVTTAIAIHDSAYRDFGEEWLYALSIAGIDGTIKKRYRYTIVKKRAFMKTGTLKRAKNIAGFVKSVNGNFYDVAIFYNGAKIWLGKDIQDKIITWLVKH